MRTKRQAGVSRLVKLLLALRCGPDGHAMGVDLTLVTESRATASFFPCSATEANELKQASGIESGYVRWGVDSAQELGEFRSDR